MRQAITGATPINSTSARTKGRMAFSKYGGPTVILSPTISSEIIGKIVPHRVTKPMARNSTFWSKNAVSRENIDSVSFSHLSVSQLRHSR